MKAPAARVDAVGTFCPMPIVLAQKRIKDLAPGEVLELLADDPGVRADVPAWCGSSGHRLLDTSEENGVIHILVERGRQGGR